MDETLNLLDDLDIEIPTQLESNVGLATPAREEFLGPYQLIEEVGSGGVARVLRARHIHPRYADQTFAVKILHDELALDPKVVNLFRREAYVLSLLKHPNIVQTFEAGVQNDKLFIAMEYIDGKDLDDTLERCRRHKMPLPFHLSMHFIGEVLKALAYAHDFKDSNSQRLGLVHRDVNPANVFISYDGRVKLGDFGVSAITAGRVEKERELAGKIGYFAPEQLEDEDVDHRADLFAVGVMMFEMLCGERLFEADSTDKMIRLNRRAKIPKPSKLNPQLPGKLERIMLMALERKPSDRYQHARDMLRELREFIPPSTGMALAVGALMRRLFLSEHIRELQLREALAGGKGPARGSGQLVAVCSGDERARLAFSELLASRGYRVVVSANAVAFGDVIAGERPEVALIDIDSPEFDLEACVEALVQHGDALPAVAIGNTLGLNTIHRAETLEAVDFVFKPFNIERVLTAVRGALSRSTTIARSEDFQAQAAMRRRRSRLLCVTRDSDLTASLIEELVVQGHLIEIAPTGTEAIERMRTASYHGIFFDEQSVAMDVADFVVHVRACAGMELVPILGFKSIGSSESGVAPALDERCALLERSEPPGLMLEKLTELRTKSNNGITFLRYETHLPLEMFYSGQVFTAEARNLSRGGVSFVCEQLPAVGSQVGLSIKLAGNLGQVTVRSRVVRVDMPEGDAIHTLISTEFERFTAGDEAKLIAFLESQRPMHMLV